MNLHRIFSHVLFFTLLAFLGVSCATIVSPSGGPKDEKAPEVSWSSPENRSAGFTGDRITIGFSEFIQLKDIDKELLVSPPFSKDPDFRIKGKSLIIRFKDTLRSNTTYNLFFGNAVGDLTEMNPLRNFSFTFATGPFIDSLSLRGQVSDAFTRLPVKDALVVLYSKQEDSVPYLEKPVYVSKVGDDGKFELNCLATGKYRLVAFRDINNDYFYTPPAELVGFSDSLAEPFYIKPAVIDTGGKVIPDSTVYPFHALSMFLEPDSNQRFQKAVMVNKHQLSLSFRYPLKDPEFIPLNIDSTAKWSMQEFTTAKDTVNCWLTGGLPDSLWLKVLDNKQVLDTIEFSTIFKPRQGTKGKSQDQDTSLKFVSTVNRSGYLDWEKPLMLTFANPLSAFDPSKAWLYEKVRNDSLHPVFEYADSIHRRVLVQHKWQTGEEYKLILPGGTFTDMYGQENDSVRISLKLLNRDEYGIFRIRVSLVNINHPVIIQLLNEKGSVLMSRNIRGPELINFGYLYPGKYTLKAIMDQNSNGKWDTGSLLQQLQPEKILVNPKMFEVRGNWELEEEWQL